MYGPAALADDELLAIILGTGGPGVTARALARRLVDRIGGLFRLAQAPAAELVAVRGIGPARATRVAAAFELGRRGLLAMASDPSLGSPADVARRLAPRLAGLEQEVFIALGVDVKNRVLAEIEVARGSLTGVDVHPRELFRPLIRCGAAGCVIAHNHPSGDPTPSADDLLLTRRLQDVGDLVGIPILDHVVVASGGFRSILSPL